MCCFFLSLGPKEEDYRLPYLSHQQLPAGILPMVPEVAQAVGACQGPHAKDYSRAIPNPGKATITAMIANELLYAGASLTAETILKNKNNLNKLPLGPLTRPSEQLGYLASVQGLQVSIHVGNSLIRLCWIWINVCHLFAGGIQRFSQKQQERVCVTDKLLLAASTHQSRDWKRC